MSEEIKILIIQRSIINELLLNLETKSYFIMAYNKFINTDDYKIYKQLKRLESKNKDIIEKIQYLETYGPVSDIIYLKSNCPEVNEYLKLKKLNRRINREIQHLNLNSNKNKKNRVRIS